MTSRIFSNEQAARVAGRPPGLSLLQALMAGVAPYSLQLSRDTFLRASSRRVNDWPEWKKELSIRNPSLTGVY